MEAKEEPSEELDDLLEQTMSEEQELDDQFLAHALAESLRGSSKQESDDGLLLPDSSFDPYLALLLVFTGPDELEDISPSEASPGREGAPAASDDGDGVLPAEDGMGLGPVASPENSEDEEVEMIGGGEPAPPAKETLTAWADEFKAVK
ncbi:unnamed protein product, partial [Symbiodinium sp. CCMP2456]